MVNGSIVGTIWGGNSNLVVFNEGIGEWISISPRENLREAGSVYYGKKVILNRNKNGDKYSLDTGRSWRDYLELGDVLKGASNVNPIFLNYDAFQMVSVQRENSETEENLINIHFIKLIYWTISLWKSF